VGIAHPKYSLPALAIIEKLFFILIVIQDGFQDRVKAIEKSMVDN
jgi:hypothetical protein